MSGFGSSGGVSLKNRIIEALAAMTRLVRPLGFGSRPEPLLPAPPQPGEIGESAQAEEPHGERDTEIAPEQHHGGRGAPHR